MEQLKKRRDGLRAGFKRLEADQQQLANVLDKWCQQQLNQPAQQVLNSFSLRRGKLQLNFKNKTLAQECSFRRNGLLSELKRHVLPVDRLTIY